MSSTPRAAASAASSRASACGGRQRLVDDDGQVRSECLAGLRGVHVGRRRQHDEVDARSASGQQLAEVGTTLDAGALARAACARSELPVTTCVTRSPSTCAEQRRMDVAAGHAVADQGDPKSSADVSSALTSGQSAAYAGRRERPRGWCTPGWCPTRRPGPSSARARRRSWPATAPDTVLLLEHPPVYTAGKRTVAVGAAHSTARPVVDVDRGGKITWHGPGQLVGYPIVRAARRRSTWSRTSAGSRRR